MRGERKRERERERYRENRENEQKKRVRQGGARWSREGEKCNQHLLPSYAIRAIGICRTQRRIEIFIAADAFHGIFGGTS